MSERHCESSREDVMRLERMFSNLQDEQSQLWSFTGRRTSSRRLLSEGEIVKLGECSLQQPPALAAGLEALSSDVVLHASPVKGLSSINNTEGSTRQKRGSLAPWRRLRPQECSAQPAGLVALPGLPTVPRESAGTVICLSLEPRELEGAAAVVEMDEEVPGNTPLNQVLWAEQTAQDTGAAMASKSAIANSTDTLSGGGDPSSGEQVASKALPHDCSTLPEEGFSWNPDAPQRQACSRLGQAASEQSLADVKDCSPLIGQCCHGHVADAPLTPMAWAGDVSPEQPAQPTATVAAWGVHVQNAGDSGKWADDSLKEPTLALQHMGAGVPAFEVVEACGPSDSASSEATRRHCAPLSPWRAPWLLGSPLPHGLPTCVPTCGTLSSHPVDLSSNSEQDSPEPPAEARRPSRLAYSTGRIPLIAFPMSMSTNCSDDAGLYGPLERLGPPEGVEGGSTSADIGVDQLQDPQDQGHFLLQRPLPHIDRFATLHCTSADEAPDIPTDVHPGQLTTSHTSPGWLGDHLQRSDTQQQQYKGQPPSSQPGARLHAAGGQLQSSAGAPDCTPFQTVQDHPAPSRCSRDGEEQLSEMTTGPDSASAPCSPPRHVSPGARHECTSSNQSAGSPGEGRITLGPGWGGWGLVSEARDCGAGDRPLTAPDMRWKRCNGGGSDRPSTSDFRGSALQRLVQRRRQQHYEALSSARASLRSSAETHEGSMLQPPLWDDMMAGAACGSSKGVVSPGTCRTRQQARSWGSMSPSLSSASSATSHDMQDVRFQDVKVMASEGMVHSPQQTHAAIGGWPSPRDWSSPSVRPYTASDILSTSLRKSRDNRPRTAVDSPDKREGDGGTPGILTGRQAQRASHPFLRRQTNKLPLLPKLDWSNVQARTVSRLEPKFIPSTQRGSSVLPHQIVAATRSCQRSHAQSCVPATASETHIMHTISPAARETSKIGMRKSCSAQRGNPLQGKQSGETAPEDLGQEGPLDDILGQVTELLSQVNTILGTG